MSWTDGDTNALKALLRAEIRRRPLDDWYGHHYRQGVELVDDWQRYSTYGADARLRIVGFELGAIFARLCERLEADGRDGEELRAATKLLACFTRHLAKIMKSAP